MSMRIKDQFEVIELTNLAANPGLYNTMSLRTRQEIRRQMAIIKPTASNFQYDSVLVQQAANAALAEAV